MTFASYPYVHTQAWGMSDARNSSGQKTVDGVGDEGACAFPVAVAEDAAVGRLNQVFGPLDFFGGSLSLLALAAAAASASQV